MNTFRRMREERKPAPQTGLNQPRFMNGDQRHDPAEVATAWVIGSSVIQV
jgi:hypothetical protein